jgi:hypothetical protein
MEKLACTSPKIIFVVDTKDVRNLEMAQHTDEVRPHRGSTESADALCRHEDIGARRTSAKLFLCFRIGEFKLCGTRRNTDQDQLPSWVYMFKWNVDKLISTGCADDGRPPGESFGAIYF